MKILKYLVPLLVIAVIASQGYAGKTRLIQPVDVTFGNVPLAFVADSAGDSFILSKKTAASITGYADSTFIGFLCNIYYGIGLNQIRYIWRNPSNATDRCTLFVTPNFSTTPGVGCSVAVFQGFTDADRMRYPFALENYIGWEVTQFETTYSEPIPCGDIYDFIYACKADTSKNDTLANATDSVDVNIWWEISHDGHNFYQPVGATSIIANIIDTLFHAKPVSLPKGTFEFRIGTAGNVTNHQTPGVVWLEQWLMFPGK